MVEQELNYKNQEYHYKNIIDKITEENLRLQKGENNQQKRYLERIRRFSQMNEDFVNQKLQVEFK